MLDDLLTRLRDYPFLEINLERIRTRAYFLSHTHPDPLLNWLEAERHEILHQASDRLLFSEGSEDFLQRYYLVHSVRYVTNQPRKKLRQGVSQPRCCSICGRSPPDARFRTEAHLLPACVGNRFLFTAEECDSCNLEAGRLTEQELGKMLAEHRAMTGIQTRTRPSAMFRLGESDSSIGGQGKSEPLRINLITGSEAVNVQHINDHTMAVSGRSAPYRPISALRSLGRVAWHLLPQELKRQHQSFLSWIVAPESTQPAQFLKLLLPGPSLKHTTFCVWARETGDGPSLLYALAIGSLVLIVPSPDWFGPDKAIPLPPFPKRPYGTPKVLHAICLDDSPVRHSFSYKFRYYSRTLTATRDAVPVLVSVGSIRINCNLIVLPPDDTRTVSYRLSGGQLGGHLSLVGAPPDILPTGEMVFGQFEVRYTLRPGEPKNDAILTFEFVRLLALGSTFSILDTRTREYIIEVASTIPIDDFNSQGLREALEDAG